MCVKFSCWQNAFLNYDYYVVKLELMDYDGQKAITPNRLYTQWMGQDGGKDGFVIWN